MIRFINTAQTIALRLSVLREGLPIEESRFTEDDLPTTFHLGYYDENENLISTLSCVKENHGKLPKSAYRLRCITTHPEHRRKGYATELLTACVEHIKNQLNIEYIWFNAQKRAFPFYESLGFEFMSDDFDIPTAGIHREMFKFL